MPEGISLQPGNNPERPAGFFLHLRAGRGTTFKIYLPRVEKSPENGKDKGRIDGLRLGGETILILEDDDDVRRSTIRILRKHGYRTLEASNSDEALQIFQKRKDPIHLLLTDVVMPGLSGPEVARRLKNFKPHMKVLFMSGYTENGILHQGVLDKKMAYLQKPFSMERLVGKVREVLEGE